MRRRTMHAHLTDAVLQQEGHEIGAPHGFLLAVADARHLHHMPTCEACSRLQEMLMYSHEVQN